MGGTLLFASLLPVALKLREQLVPSEQERKLGEQEIHLAIFEILGEKSAFISHIQNKHKIFWGILQRELLSAQQFSVEPTDCSFSPSLCVFLSL